MTNAELRKAVEAAIPGISAAGWQIDDIIRRLRASRDIPATKRTILSEEIVAGMINKRTLPKVVNFIAARL
jgi:hypothetical protein